MYQLSMPFSVICINAVRAYHWLPFGSVHRSIACSLLLKLLSAYRRRPHYRLYRRRPHANSTETEYALASLSSYRSVVVHHHHHHHFNLLTSSAVSPLHRLFQRSLTTLSSSTTVHTSIIIFYSYLLYFLNRWFEFDSSCVFFEILFGLVSQQSKECEQRIR